MKRLLLKYGVVGLVCLVVAVECILRWGVGLGDPPLARLDPLTEYELVPSATYRRWGNTITINAHGMRAAEHPDVPAANERHLILVGDSVIYGGHFLDQTETISAQLDQILGQEERFAECTIRVLPISASSWGPVNQTAALQKYGTFGATAVGIVVSAHDLSDVPNTLPDILPYRTTASITAIGDAVQILLERFWLPTKSEGASQPFAVRAHLSLSALDRAADLLHSQSVSLILIYHPTMTERRGQVRTEREVFWDWSKTRSVPFVDLGSIPMVDTDYRDDIHPAATGARRIAQAIAPIMGANIVPCLGL